MTQVMSHEKERTSHEKTGCVMTVPEYKPAPLRKASTASFCKRASADDQEDEEPEAEQVWGRAPGRADQARGSSGASSGVSRSDANKRPHTQAPAAEVDEYEEEDNESYVAAATNTEFWKGLEKDAAATMPKISTPLDVGRAQSCQPSVAARAGACVIRDMSDCNTHVGILNSEAALWARTRTRCVPTVCSCPHTDNVLF